MDRSEFSNGVEQNSKSLSLAFSRKVWWRLLNMATLPYHHGSPRYPSWCPPQQGTQGYLDECRTSFPYRLTIKRPPQKTNPKCHQVDTLQCVVKRVPVSVSCCLFFISFLSFYPAPIQALSLSPPCRLLISATDETAFLISVPLAYYHKLDFYPNSA